MHSPKAMTPFAGQYDNSVWVKRLRLQPGMPYKKRWHDMIASLASIWNNSLEKAWGKAASPCWSNQPPPFGQNVADSLACVYLLAHVVFHSSSKHCNGDFTVRAWLATALSFCPDSGLCPILCGILRDSLQSHNLLHCLGIFVLCIRWYWNRLTGTLLLFVVG